MNWLNKFQSITKYTILEDGSNVSRILSKDGDMIKYDEAEAFIAEMQYEMDGMVNKIKALERRLHHSNTERIKVTNVIGRSKKLI